MFDLRGSLPDSIRFPKEISARRNRCSFGWSATYRNQQTSSDFDSCSSKLALFSTRY